MMLLKVEGKNFHSYVLACALALALTAAGSVLPVGTVQAQTRGQVAFEYDPAADLYRCPEGNRLRRRKRRIDSGPMRGAP